MLRKYNELSNNEKKDLIKLIIEEEKDKKREKEYDNAFTIRLIGITGVLGSFITTPLHMAAGNKTIPNWLLVYIGLSSFIYTYGLIKKIGEDDFNKQKLEHETNFNNYLKEHQISKEIKKDIKIKKK